MKPILCLLSFIVLNIHTLLGQVPDFSWAISGLAYTTKVAVDQEQNSVIAGTFWDSGIFAPGMAYNQIKARGQSDIFLEKLDSNGALLWLHIIAGLDAEDIDAISTDFQGNIYLLGTFWGNVDMDPSEGVYEITPPAGFGDLFVLKLSPNGEFIWVKSMGSRLFDGGSSITVDAPGNIYITGYFGDHVNDMDPGAAVHTLSYYGGIYDAFIMKLDAGGNFSWCHSIGGSESDFMNDVAFDNSGNVYTTGSFSNTAHCSSGTSFVSHGGTDAFVQKFNSSGELLWSYSMGGSYADLGRAIQTDGSGDVIVAGNFSDTIDLNPGAPTQIHVNHGSALFLQKLNPDGTLIWAIAKAGNNNSISDLAIDPTDNVYITGSFKGSIELGTMSEPMPVISINGPNAFVQKMDSSGIAVWGMSIPCDSRAGTIVVDMQSNAYIMGTFNSTVDFDPHASEFVIPYGGYFLMRLGSPTNHIRWDDPYYYPENKITLHPNPTNDIVNVKQLATFDLAIEICDYLGRIVQQVNSSELSIIVSLRDHPPGIYWFRITYNDTVFTQKILKI
jgi:hypothetical protein